MVSSLEEGENDESVKENTILQISWKTEIPDRADDNPFKDFDPFSFEPNQAVGLNEILKTIDRAKNDDNIVGILLDMESLPAGVATMQEIRNKLEDFKSSGKFIYSYANNYDQKAYYLATVSDKIFINPEGFILFKGLYSQTAYLKNLLDKIGIKAQVIRGPTTNTKVRWNLLFMINPVRQTKNKFRLYSATFGMTYLKQCQKQEISVSKTLTGLQIIWNWNRQKPPKT